MSTDSERWWCWTEDEPSTFRCRERGHDIRVRRKLGDVPTAEWRTAAGLPPLMPGGESTSAQLANARDQLEREQAKSGRLGAAYRHVCTMLAAAITERDQERDRADELARRLAARLGTLLEKDEQLRSVRDELDQERGRHRVLWNIERDACVKLRARLREAREERDDARRGLDRAEAEREPAELRRYAETLAQALTDAHAELGRARQQITTQRRELDVRGQAITAADARIRELTAEQSTTDKEPTE